MKPGPSIPMTCCSFDAYMPSIIAYRETRDRLSLPAGVDAMATNGNQTRMEASVAAQRTSPSAAAGKPGRGVQRASNNQEEQRHSDRLWLPKQRSSPSLLFYRRLSDDSSEGAASNEEYDCLDLGAARGAPLQPSAFRTTSSEEGRGGNTCRNSRCCTAPGNCSFHSSASSPTSSASPDDSPQLTSSPARPNPRHSRRSSLPVSMLPFHTTSPCLSSRCGISSEPNSLGSSPAASPLVNHRQRRHNGHVHRDYHKDGYSSLERLNRRPRVNKCSREKFFLRRASLQTVTMRSLRGEEVSSSPATRNCSREGSSSSSSGNSSNSDEEFGGGFSDSADFIRNRKERSTVLVRRFFKNNQKVTKSVCTGTRAIVKTLPSGRISEEVWELVDSHGSRRPSKREVWPILKRLVGGEELRISRGILRLVRVELHLVTRYVQDKKELPLTHPAEKLLLQRSRCACRRSTLAASDDPTGTNRYHPCWCGTSHPHSFYRACLQRTLLCSLLTGALLEATAALGARSALPYPPTQGLNCQAVLKERQLANSMTSSSSLSPSLSGISKELVEMRHLVQFPEEIACILTEQEQQLYQRVFPLDYLCFLTRDLSSPDAQSKRHPSLRASLSVPAMPSQSAQRSSPVEDLVARFNEVKGRRWGYRRHWEFEEK